MQQEGARQPRSLLLFGLLAVVTCLEGCNSPPALPSAPPPLHVTATPVPPGTPARVGDYEVTVLGVEPDATRAVLSEFGQYRLNRDPPPGRRFTLVRLRVDFVGPVRGLFSFDTAVALVAPDGTRYGREAGCGYVPDDLGLAGEQFPGQNQTVEGNVCRALPALDVSSLELNLRPYRDRGAPGVTFALPR